MKRRPSKEIFFSRILASAIKIMPLRESWHYFVFTLILSQSVSAARVDTLSIYSQAMHKAFFCVVVTPDSYKKTTHSRPVKTYPVVYLLHGWAGSYSNWIIRVPSIKSLADLYQIIIVCPDGGFSGWYLDSPVDSSFRYETYIGTEVPAYIDSHYRSIKERKGRAITGLSMGGQGALRLAFYHSSFFGACGSMSGVVDLNSVNNRYDLIKRLGDTIAHADNWRKFSVVNVIETYPNDSLAIIIDCGTTDFLYNDNHLLHEKLLRLRVPHTYTERPGQHDWPYWRNAIEYQLLFFHNYFNGKN